MLPPPPPPPLSNYWGGGGAAPPPLPTPMNYDIGLAVYWTVSVGTVTDCVSVRIPSVT